MPRSGGLYTYLREVFGDTVAFFYGWANFMIAGSGGIAAVAFILASYAGEILGVQQNHGPGTLDVCVPWLGCLYPLANIGEKILGSGVVLFLTWVNLRGLRAGAALQAVSTSLKLLALIFVVFTGFSDPAGSFHKLTVVSSTHPTDRHDDPDCHVFAGERSISLRAYSLNGRAPFTSVT